MTRPRFARFFAGTGNFVLLPLSRSARTPLLDVKAKVKNSKLPVIRIVLGEFYSAVIGGNSFLVFGIFLLFAVVLS